VIVKFELYRSGISTISTLFPRNKMFAASAKD
jgi:hypothetical protein